MAENTSFIPNRLKNATQGGHVAGAIDILDDVKNKNQQRINADVDETLDLHQSEINALDSQNYYTVEATDADTSIESIMSRAGVVPAKDTVYRVGFWDGTEYGESKYSEYAWNESGNTWKLLDVKEYTLATAEDFIEPDATKRAKIPTVGAAADVYGSYTDSPEFVKVTTDAEDRVLEGIKADGTKYVGGDLEVGGELHNAGLDAKFANKVDKAEGRSLIDSDFAASQSSITNPEYLQVTTDSEDKILEGIKTDGTKVIGGDVQIGGNATILGRVDIQGATYTLMQSPEWIIVIVDAQNRILCGIKIDGRFYADIAGLDETTQALISQVEAMIAQAESDIQQQIQIITDIFSTVDNPEWIQVTTDAEGKILEGITYEGKKKVMVDVEYPNGIPSEIAKHITKSITEENPVTFGSNYEGHSQTLNNASYLIALKDTYSNIKGWLTKVGFYTNTAGEKTLYIGYIDQRTTAIVRKSFTCQATVGFNDIDVSEQHIIIEKDETLFIKANGIGYNVLGASDYYPKMLSGAYNGVLSEDSSQYGASLRFTWDIVQIESMYPFKEDTDAVEENVSSNTNAIMSINHRMNKVYDNDGNAYKIKVVNGELTPVILNYRKVLIIGNSLTWHQYDISDEVWWWAGNRGMAATKFETDYCAFLKEGLRVKEPTADFLRCNGYWWERNLPVDYETLRGYLKVDPDIYPEAEDKGRLLTSEDEFDLVIFAVVDNITTTDSNAIYNSTKAFLEVIKGIWPSADILALSSKICIGEPNDSPFNYKDVAIQKVVWELGLGYADVRLRSFDNFVTNFITGEWVPIYMQGDGEVFVAQKIVSTHFCDIGMFRTANTILTELSYPTLSKIHNIAVTCSQDHYAPSYWVEDGIVTILCYDSMPQSVTVTDANNDNVSFDLKDMTDAHIYATPSKRPVAGVVFTMPDTNVTVIIN